MPTKATHSTIARYVGALTGVHQRAEDTDLFVYLGRVFNSPNFRPPWTDFDVIEQRCSFIESVLLGRAKSIVLGRLEMTEQVTLVGIEQSSAFVGKDSVFVAFALDSPRDLADVFGEGRTAPEAHKRGYPVCTRLQDERVYVTCPLSAFVLPN